MGRADSGLNAIKKLLPKSWQDQITIGTKDEEPTWDSGEAGGFGCARK
jgi:hypothetical protein